MSEIEELESELAEAERMGLKQRQHALAMELAALRQDPQYASLAVNAACTVEEWVEAIVLQAKLGNSVNHAHLVILRQLARKQAIPANGWRLLGEEALARGDLAEAFAALQQAVQGGLGGLERVLAMLAICLDHDDLGVRDGSLTRWLAAWRACKYAEVVRELDRLPHENLLHSLVKKAVLRAYLRPLIKVSWERLVAETGVLDISLIPPGYRLEGSNIIYEEKALIKQAISLYPDCATLFTELTN